MDMRLHMQEMRYACEPIDIALAAEDRAEARAEWIENRATQLMQDGEEYDPFATVNISEALSELSCKPSFLADLNLLLNDPHGTYTAGSTLKNAIENYWYALALSRAERDFDDQRPLDFGDD